MSNYALKEEKGALYAMSESPTYQKGGQVSNWQEVNVRCGERLVARG